MDFKQHYFALFKLPIEFNLDLAQLKNSYRELQRQLHPDNFADQTEFEKRGSVQASALINEAHAVLKAPVSRAHYMLQLLGKEFDLATQTISDASFLMQQMEWREQLEEVKHNAEPENELIRIRDNINSLFESYCDQFAAMSEQWDFKNPSTNDSASIDQSSELVCKMKFIEKLLNEIEQIEDSLLD